MTAFFARTPTEQPLRTYFARPTVYTQEVAATEPTDAEASSEEEESAFFAAQ